VGHVGQGSRCAVGRVTQGVIGDQGGDRWSERMRDQRLDKRHEAEAWRYYAPIDRLR